MSTIKDRQERFKAALQTFTYSDLREIVEDVVYTLYGAQLDPDFQGSSDTLGDLYSTIVKQGLEPVGPVEDNAEGEYV